MAAGLSRGNFTNALILHWNGTAWKRVRGLSPGTGGLSAVTAISATDAWATGSPPFLHWTGAAWKQVPSVSPVGADSVTATSATNAWAVGNTHPSRNVYKIVILHWNGTAWKRR